MNIPPDWYKSKAEPRLCYLYTPLFETIFVLEPLDTPRRKHKTLLTGKERVALGAKFNAQILFG